MHRKEENSLFSILYSLFSILSPSYRRESKAYRRGTKSAINYVHLLKACQGEIWIILIFTIAVIG